MSIPSTSMSCSCTCASTSRLPSTPPRSRSCASLAKSRVRRAHCGSRYCFSSFSLSRTCPSASTMSIPFIHPPPPGRCAPPIDQSLQAPGSQGSTLTIVAQGGLLRRPFLEDHPLVGNRLALTLAIGAAAGLRVEELLDRAPVALFV